MYALPIAPRVFSWATTSVPARALQVGEDGPSLRLRAEQSSPFEHLASDRRAGGGDVAALARGRFARETSGTGGAALYLFAQLALSEARP